MKFATSRDRIPLTVAQAMQLEGFQALLYPRGEPMPSFQQIQHHYHQSLNMPPSGHRNLSPSATASATMPLNAAAPKSLPTTSSAASLANDSLARSSISTTSADVPAIVVTPPREQASQSTSAPPRNRAKQPQSIAKDSLAPASPAANPANFALAGASISVTPLNASASSTTSPLTKTSRTTRNQLKVPKSLTRDDNKGKSSRSTRTPEEATTSKGASTAASPSKAGKPEESTVCSHSLIYPQQPHDFKIGDALPTICRGDIILILNGITYYNGISCDSSSFLFVAKDDEKGSDLVDFIHGIEVAGDSDSE
ncbi:hypothetical protein L1887_41919 [Cichorium endivia]|nr:hypothetical protein L1887_41919 [Cichorium endivia]